MNNASVPAGLLVNLLVGGCVILASLWGNGMGKKTALRAMSPEKR